MLRLKLLNVLLRNSPLNIIIVAALCYVSCCGGGRYNLIAYFYHFKFKRERNRIIFFLLGALSTVMSL